jgi:hypothetical protein
MARAKGTGPPEAASSLAGLAVCLALLELEARDLGRPLAAALIAAAGEALRERPEQLPAAPEHPPVSPIEAR